MEFEDYEKFRSIFVPWFAAADIDERGARLSGTNSNDASGMKQLIERDLIPAFYGSGQPPGVDLSEHQTRVCNGIRFALQASEGELHHCWDAMLPVFDLPEKPHNLFIWIKEVFDKHKIEFR